MREEFYTRNGRHPDDVICEVKKFIQELSRVQDGYFRRLVRDLGLGERGADYLFDYVYNCADDDKFDSFEDYLGKYSSYSYEDLIEDFGPIGF